MTTWAEWAKWDASPSEARALRTARRMLRDGQVLTVVGLADRLTGCGRKPVDGRTREGRHWAVTACDAANALTCLRETGEAIRVRVPGGPVFTMTRDAAEALVAEVTDAIRAGGAA